VIIRNRKLRKEFALPGRCEWCQRFCVKREPHHLRTRTPELTIRINLFSVGNSPLFFCSCHTLIGAGKIPASEVLKRVATRENVRPSEITDVMNLFRRLVRPTRSQLVIGLGELGTMARVLAIRELREAKVLL
jgi:hypothetical protein